MKNYDQGYWGIALIFQLEGSVLPKSVCWAGPSATLAGFFHYLMWDLQDDWHREQLRAHVDDVAMNVGVMWSGFTVVLAALIAFRSQQAYARYWEGATIMRAMRGEWFNATSSLISFTSPDRSKRHEVESFQHLLIRLISMLHCAALEACADKAVVETHYGTLGAQQMGEESIRFLSKLDQEHRCEVLLQWIQRLISLSSWNGVLSIAPPILSRAYQELSRGIVKLTELKKLSDIPFPFPFTQLLTVLLLVVSAMTPVVSALLFKAKFTACLFTFLVILAFVSVHYISAEIESPFGDDPNDLRLDEFQDEMNKSLWMLLNRRVQEPPSFRFVKSIHRSGQDAIVAQWSDGATGENGRRKAASASNKDRRSSSRMRFKGSGSDIASKWSKVIPRSIRSSIAGRCSAVMGSNASNASGLSMHSIESTSTENAHRRSAFDDIDDDDDDDPGGCRRSVSGWSDGPTDSFSPSASSMSRDVVIGSEDRVQTDEKLDALVVGSTATSASMASSMVVEESSTCASRRRGPRGSMITTHSIDSLRSTDTRGFDHGSSMPYGTYSSGLQPSIQEPGIPSEHPDALVKYDAALRECLETLMDRIGECTAHMRQAERRRSDASEISSSSVGSGAEAPTAFQQANAGNSFAKASNPSGLPWRRTEQEAVPGPTTLPTVPSGSPMLPRPASSPRTPRQDAATE